MNFENSNRLYELAAEDPGLEERLKELNKEYSHRMQDYIFSLAGKYGIKLEEDSFSLSENREDNWRKEARLRIIGLILEKKEEEKSAFHTFSKELDRKYAEEKIKLAKEWDIFLSWEEAIKLSEETGIL